MSSAAGPRSSTSGGQAVLSLGSNLPPREAWLDRAWDTLATAGAVVVASTPRWNTRPLGGPPQPDYLDQLLLAEGPWDAWGWLRVAQLAEAEAGRVRLIDKGPRRLDVDVILIEAETVSSRELVIPHPALLQRPFLLAGAAALVPHWIAPGWPAEMDQLARAQLTGLWARAVPITAGAGRPGRV